MTQPPRHQSPSKGEVVARVVVVVGLAAAAGLLIVCGSPENDHVASGATCLPFPAARAAL